MINKDLIRLIMLSLKQSQKMHEEMVDVLNLDIRDEKMRLMRVYLLQNIAILKLIEKNFNYQIKTSK